MKEQLATFRTQLEEFARKHKVIPTPVFQLSFTENITDAIRMSQIELHIACFHDLLNLGDQDISVILAD